MTRGHRRRGLLTRVAELVVTTSRLYVASPTPNTFPVAPPYLLRRATPEDLARLETDLSGELSPAKAVLIRARAASDDTEVTVAVDPDGRVCGYGHSHDGWVKDDHLQLDLGPIPGVVHLFDDYVALSHRGHRLQAAILAARLDAARARPSTVSVSILVADSNHASRRSVRIAGFTPVVRVVTLRGPGGRRSWALGTRPGDRLLRASGSSSVGPR